MNEPYNFGDTFDKSLEKESELEIYKTPKCLNYSDKDNCCIHIKLIKDGLSIISEKDLFKNCNGYCKNNLCVWYKPYLTEIEQHELNRLKNLSVSQYQINFVLKNERLRK